VTPDVATEDLGLFEPFSGTESVNPRGIGFWAHVAEDWRTQGRQIMNQGFWVLLLHRFGNWHLTIRPPVLRVLFTLVYRVMHKACQWRGIDIACIIRVGRRVRLEPAGGMVPSARAMGDEVIIPRNTTLGVSGLDDRRRRPSVGGFTGIGLGAVGHGRISAGKEASVDASAMVAASVSSRQIVGGFPARRRWSRDAFTSRSP
jgi:serine O-acetyltransferase